MHCYQLLLIEIFLNPEIGRSLKINRIDKMYMGNEISLKATKLGMTSCSVDKRKRLQFAYKTNLHETLNFVYQRPN